MALPVFSGPHTGCSRGGARGGLGRPVPSQPCVEGEHTKAGLSAEGSVVYSLQRAGPDRRHVHESSGHPWGPRESEGDGDGWTRWACDLQCDDPAWLPHGGMAGPRAGSVAALVKSLEPWGCHVPPTRGQQLDHGVTSSRCAWPPLPHCLCGEIPGQLSKVMGIYPPGRAGIPTSPVHVWPRPLSNSMEFDNW